MIESAKKLSGITSAPCYLTLCDGARAVVVEKDVFTGRIREDEKFIVQTNHDSCNATKCGAEERSEPVTPHPELWLRDSNDRMDVILDKWTKSGSEVVDVETLAEWMSDERISNNFTHFACVMDPVQGSVPWLKRGPPPQSLKPEV